MFVAGYGPKALAVAGRVGDGVIIQLADPQIVSWIMDTARASAEEAGRDPAALKCHVCAPSHISDDIADAREQVRWFPAMVSNHVMDLVERYGFDSEIPAALTEFVKARKFYDYKDHSRVGAAHGEFVTDEICDRFCVLGTPEQAIAKLRELESVGVDHFNIYLMTQGQEETLQAYGDHILPEFASRRPREAAVPSAACDLLEVPFGLPADLSADGETVLVQWNATGTMQLYRAPWTRRRARAADRLRRARRRPLRPRQRAGSCSSATRAGTSATSSTCSTRGPAPSPSRSSSSRTSCTSRRGSRDDGRLLAYGCNRRNGVDLDVYVRSLESGEERCVFAPGGYCEVGRLLARRPWLTVLRLTDRTATTTSISSTSRAAARPSSRRRRRMRSSTCPAWLPGGESFLFATSAGRDTVGIAPLRARDRRAGGLCSRPTGTSSSASTAPAGTLVVAGERRGRDAARAARPGDARAAARARSAGARCRRRHRALATTAGGSRRLRLAAHPVERLARRHRDRRDAPADGALADRGRGRARRPDASSATRPSTASRFPSSSSSRPASSGRRSWSRSTAGRSRSASSRGCRSCSTSSRAGSRSRSRTSAARPATGSASSTSTTRGCGSTRSATSPRCTSGSAADGRCDTGRSVLYGGSYGGYMTLAGLAFQPELWAAGIAVVRSRASSPSSRTRPSGGERSASASTGRSSTTASSSREASPITHVDAIRAPLLLIHGANDPRVPLGEAEQIHAALRGRGIRSELLVYDDEGHGLQKLKNRLDAYPQAVDVPRRGARVEPSRRRSAGCCPSRARSAGSRAGWRSSGGSRRPCSLRAVPRRR